MKRIPIAQVSEGSAAKIGGKVVALETIPAPISGRPCVFWEVAVEEHRPSVESDRWVEILRRIGGVAFAVDDDTMRAHVDPAEAREVLVEVERLWGEGGDLQERGAAFLARHGLRAAGRKLRYLEGVIEVGDVVAVAGIGVREANRDPRAATGGYRDGPAIRLLLRGTSEHPLLITTE